MQREITDDLDLLLDALPPQIEVEKPNPQVCLQRSPVRIDPAWQPSAGRVSHRTTGRSLTAMGPATTSPVRETWYSRGPVVMHG